MPHPGARALHLPPPPPELAELSLRLGECMLAQIEQHGPLPFDRYMAMALYQPGLGYYVNGLHKFGAAGDFVTAPEQGSLFARALARQVEQIAAELGGDYSIMEPGAGSGAMAQDLLLTLDPAPQRYLILEPSAALREVQGERLRRLPETLFSRVQWIDSPPDTPFDGLVIANEVIDALPVACFKVGPDGLMERCVGVQDQRLGWIDCAPRPRLAAAFEQLQEQLGRRLASTYCSEICLDLAGWLDTVTRPLRRGAVLLVDYGYPRSEYYLPARSEGTLVCHYRHRAHFDPFVWPGLTDLSAFVDFSALAAAGPLCGLDLLGFTTQADFLLAMDAHQAIEQASDDRTRLQLAGEFKRLVMPGEMGEKFKVLGFGRGLAGPAEGLSTVDQSHRL